MIKIISNVEVNTKFSLILEAVGDQVDLGKIMRTFRIISWFIQLLLCILHTVTMSYNEDTQHSPEHVTKRQRKNRPVPLNFQQVPYTNKLVPLKAELPPVAYSIPNAQTVPDLLDELAEEDEKTRPVSCKCHAFDISEPMGDMLRLSEVHMCSAVRDNVRLAVLNNKEQFNGFYVQFIAVNASSDGSLSVRPISELKFKSLRSIDTIQNIAGLCMVSETALGGYE